jgi:hypothetical protein
MRVDTVIMADAVSTPPDGKFYVHGGGLSRSEVPALPFPISLGVLIRLLVEDGDVGKAFVLSVVLIGPTGNPNVPGAELELQVPPDMAVAIEGEERFANISLGIPAVAQREGVHRLEVRLNGQVAKSQSFPVLLVQPEPLVPDVGQEWPRPPNGDV